MARMTIEIPDSVRERIETLRIKSESATLTEVIRRSLALAEPLFDHVAAGGVVLLKASDGTIRELVVR